MCEYGDEISAWSYFLYRMKMEKKKVQQETKKEHRRVMVAVDEFLKVNESIDYT